MTLDYVPHVPGDSLDLIVDVSNVCLERSVAPLSESARWERLPNLIDAWIRFRRTQDQERQRPWSVLCIADKSLMSHFTEEDRDLAKAAQQAGLLRFADFADPVIIDLAQEFPSAYVLSNDGYLDRRSEDDRELIKRLKKFEWDQNGEIIRFDRHTPIRQPDVKSKLLLRKAVKDHKRKWGNTSRDPSIEPLFTCPNESCVRSEYVAFLPSHVTNENRKRRQRGLGPACDKCATPLNRIHSSVRPGKKVIIELLSPSAPDAKAAYWHDDGTSVSIGRDGELNVARALDLGQHDEQIAGVSREHLLLRLDGSRLVAEVASNVNSPNHTEFLAATDRESGNLTNEQQVESGRRRGLVRELSRGDIVEVRPRDILVLGGAIVVRLSGSQSPIDTRAFAAPEDGFRMLQPRTRTT